MKTHYKIVLQEKGILKLVHFGINGSRILPTNKWIKAELKKDVIDGSKGTKYTSGIHFLKTKEEAELYLKKFKKGENYRIVPIYVKGVRKKEHSPNNVYLANEIKIII